MADGKDFKKAPPKVSFEDENTKLISFIFFLLIIGALFARLTFLFGDDTSFGVETVFGRISAYFSTHILPFLTLISFILSGAFIVGIAWSVAKLTALNKELFAIYHPLQSVGESLLDDNSDSKTPVNQKWNRVLSHLNTQNPNDWKFAILEADIMLADLLDTLQYRGATIADKLKVVESSDFHTLEAAWEAHKIRNTIAHEGADFVLSEREARRVIDLYRVVFEEFQII